MMSDLLEKFVGIVEEKQGGAWHGEESIPVRLSEEEMREAITAQQALRDLETLYETFRCPVSILPNVPDRGGDFLVISKRGYGFGNGYIEGHGQTIPAALRAAVEAIQKGETE